MSKITKHLVEIFGSQSFFASTGNVMIAPSSITREQALECVERVGLEPVLRDLAIVMARELEGDMMSRGLRPADYADLPDLPDIIADRLAQELAKVPREFAVALIDHLRRSS